MDQKFICMKKWGRSLCLYCMLFTSILLISCGAVGKESAKQDAADWSVKTKEITEAQNYPVSLGSLQAVGNHAYYYCQKDEGSYLCKISSDDQKVRIIREFPDLRKWIPFYVSEDESQMVYFLPDEDGGQVCYMDTSGNLLREIKIEQTISDQKLPSRMAVLPDGEVALLFVGHLVTLNREGAVLSDIELDRESAYDLAPGEDGFRWEKQSEHPDRFAEYPLDWTALGLLEIDILDLSESDGRFYVWSSGLLTNPNAPLYLHIVEQREAGEAGEPEQEKTRVTVVVRGIDMGLDAAAVAFNRQNDDIEVLVEHLDQSQNAWNLRLASKEPIDLALLPTSEFRILQGAGYLEPLDAYWEFLGQRKEEIMPSMLACFQMDGKTYGIPRNIGIRVPYVRIAGGCGMEANTTADFLKMMEEHPGLKSENGINPYEIMRICLIADLDRYLTEENGKIHFDLDLCRELCVAIRDLESDKVAYYDRWEELLGSDEDLFSELYVSRAKDMADLFQKAGEEVQLIGYPSADPQIKSIVRSSAMCLVNKSEHRDEALLFLKFYYDSYEEFYPRENWSVSWEGIQQQIADAGEEHLLPDGTKWQLSPEQQEMMLDILQNTESQNPYFEQIYQIICEEIDGFWKGEKDIDAVMKIIESRINLYLVE